MNAYIQTKSDEPHIAFLKNGKLVRYMILEKDTAMEKDMYIGVIGKKINRMNAYLVTYEKDKEALLKSHEIPKNLRGRCTEGSRVLLQVVKEGFKDKMPQMTLNLQYQGKYFVWIPYEAGVFFSKKISREMKEADKSMIQSWQKQDGGCLIVRTEAKNASMHDLEKEYIKLKEKWQLHMQQIKRKERVQRLTDEWTRLKNIFLNEKEGFQSIVVDSAKYKIALTELFPHIEIQTYLDKVPLFEQARILEQLDVACCDKVKTSDYGLSFMIHETEAATFIDINSGASFMEKTIEMAAFENNKESIPFLVNQIEARNLSGVIFIDFINMKKKEHQIEIIKQMKQAFQKEGKRTEIYDFTKLGFLEMRRARKGKRLSEYFLQSCPQCHGKGFVIRNKDVK